MKSRPRAEAASSNLLALHRAVQKHAPTPHGTRARFAAIHQLISSFRVRASDPAGARITSISGTTATRRRRVGSNEGFAFTALRLRQAPAAHGRAHRRGPLRCPNAKQKATTPSAALLHRTLVFPWGCVGPRPEASRTPGYGEFRCRRGRPQGGQLSTRPPATGPVARGEELQVF